MQWFQQSKTRKRNMPPPTLSLSGCPARSDLRRCLVERPISLFVAWVSDAMLCSRYTVRLDAAPLFIRFPGSLAWLNFIVLCDTGPSTTNRTNKLLGLVVQFCFSFLYPLSFYRSCWSRSKYPPRQGVSAYHLLKRVFILVSSPIFYCGHICPFFRSQSSAFTGNICVVRLCFVLFCYSDSW